MAILEKELKGLKGLRVVEDEDVEKVELKKEETKEEVKQIKKEEIKKVPKVKSDDWAEKYRPRALEGVIGHPTAIAEFKEWASSWLGGKIPKNRAVVLYGKPGIGKTTAGHALARDMGWEVVELNASDQRTASVIKDIAGSATQMQTFETIEKKGEKEKRKEKRLIIIDEADNIHGTADRGGEKALIEIIRKTNQPIVLIANDLFDMSSGLRGVCRKIQFKSVNVHSVVAVLRRIASAEGIVVGTGVLERIAENASGDIRSAINDLQAVSIGRTKIDINDIITGDRDNKENIFKVLQKIFKGTNIAESSSATMGLDENPENFIQWIDENLPMEYTMPKDLDEGYRHLERASLFLGRVRRRQDYGMWKYANFLMTSGITASRSVRYGGYTQFQYPNIRRKLSQTRSKRGVRTSVAKKIGSHCHVSIKFALVEIFPYFKMMMIKDERFATSVSALLDLEEEEIAFLLETDVNAFIKKIHKDAQSIIERDVEHEIEGGFGAGWKKPEKKELKEKELKELKEKELKEIEKKEGKVEKEEGAEEEYEDFESFEEKKEEVKEEKEKQKDKKYLKEKKDKEEDKKQKSIFDF